MTNELESKIERNPRKHPNVNKSADGEANVSAISVDDICELFGVKNDEVAKALLISSLDALGDNGERYWNFMAALPAEIEPRDALEGMLAIQLGSTHLAFVELHRRMRHATNYEHRESLERSVTRLSRTYLAQIEALRKHRAKAQQTVRVERVTVNEGGQAIVGDVTHSGAG